MPPSSISAQTWETHKSTIVDLWKNQNHKLEDVVQEMRQRGFVASKQQYIRQFKKWQVSKNRTGNEWRYISNVLTRRSRQGKASIVVMGGEQVDDAKVRKRTRDFEIPRWLSPGSTPEPMEGIEVHTPGASTPEAFSRTTHGVLQHARMIDLTNIPFLELPNGPPTLEPMGGSEVFTPEALSIRENGIFQRARVIGLSDLPCFQFQKCLDKVLKPIMEANLQIVRLSDIQTMLQVVIPQILEP